MSFKKLKSINQTTKDLVFGFIRKETKSISHTTIPMMVNYFCLLFYYLVSDKFIRGSSRITISSSDPNQNRKGDVATMYAGGYGSILETVYGNIILNIKENPTMVATWKIKLNTYCCKIGIVKNVGDWLDYECKYRVDHPRSDEIVGEYGDEIKMELDVSKRELNFYENNSKTAHFTINDIELSDSYRLKICVNCSTNPQNIKIIDFNVENCKSVRFDNKYWL